MEYVRRLKFIVGVYFVVLGFLLLAVIAMPLVIRGGIAIAHNELIGEEILETSLILTLFIASFFILKGFKHALEAYQNAVEQAGRENSRLISNLAEAFRYIGTVNVEFQSIQSFLCGVEHYPQTHKELKLLLTQLASHAKAVAKTSWVAIRMIERSSGRTISEYSVQRRKGVLPATTIGNRAILEGDRTTGFQGISSRQTNLDLLTVCILPATSLTEEQRILLTAIVNQVEMLFVIGCQDSNHAKITFEHENNERKTHHDLHQ